jgi:hypothetical protein
MHTSRSPPTDASSEPKPPPTPRATATMASPSPRAPIQEPRSSLSTTPSRRPQTEAVAKTSEAFEPLVRLRPTV